MQLTNFADEVPVVIEASTDLLRWTPVDSNASGFGTAQFVDSAASNCPVWFYRKTTP